MCCGLVHAWYPVRTRDVAFAAANKPGFVGWASGAFTSQKDLCLWLWDLRTRALILLPVGVRCFLPVQFFCPCDTNKHSRHAGGSPTRRGLLLACFLACKQPELRPEI